jgi:hypothetical protein
VKAILKVALAVIFFSCLTVRLVCGWSNGGYSNDLASPKYGTHDWIAQHALDWLPTLEKQYLLDNLPRYLFGTELPDNGGAPDGIGDTTKHHVYFSSSGTVADDSSAIRANEEYNIALNYLKAQDYADAAKTAGDMTHYISDSGVFGHVMGASTPWGTEIHHSDYEDYVDARTGSYSGIGTNNFNSCLLFDGSLTNLTAYNAALDLAYDTTFGGSSHMTCTWMDSNYNWSNSTFSGRCGQSLNLAVNAVTDVLHTLFQAAALASPTTSPIVSPTNSPTVTPSQVPSTSSTTSHSVTVTQVPINSPSVTSSASSTSTINVSPSPNSINNTTSTPTTPEFSFAPAIAVAIISTAFTLAWKLKRPMAIK